MAPNYFVRFRKRGTSDIVEGTCYDDGLTSIVGVDTEQGTVYLSVLDDVIERTPISTDRGRYYLAGASEERWS